MAPPRTRVRSSRAFASESRAVGGQGALLAAAYAGVEWCGGMRRSVLLMTASLHPPAGRDSSGSRVAAAARAHRTARSSAPRSSAALA
ncbi:hypothetical protein GCM10009579_82050 [Streptomyces javensis]|uniref:Uncharacterized protein n=1 Tax=Streptomyces javensis TaxID=114698 RepID=A0ABN1XDH6_9ACTN